MKRPSLLPSMLAATLFLDGGLRAEEAKPAAPALAAAPAPAQGETEKPDEKAKQRQAEAVAAEVARRRALQALRSDLIALFDKNGNGKFDGDELAAVNVFLTSSGVPVALTPTPAEEQARLERVAVEVAKRRAVREEAAQGIGNSLPPRATESLEETIRSLRASLERLEKIASDRAKEKAKPAGERK